MRSPILLVSVSLALLAACSRTARPNLPGLVLQLELDDDSTAVAVADLPQTTSTSGLGFVDGVAGRALSVDGSGAQIALEHPERLELSRALTLEFYVNFADWKNPYPAGGGLESVVSHSDNFTVAVDPHTWRLQARVTTNGDPEPVSLAGGIVTPGTWHHVALVFEGERSSARLVLDGAEVARTEARGELVVRPNVSIVIGTWFKRNNAFCGALDSIRIWNRALAAEELAARAARAGPGTPKTALAR